MAADIELVPVRRDRRGNVREWRVERTQNPIQPTQGALPAEKVIYLPAESKGAPGRVSSSVSGSYSDRAKAFSLATWQMGTVAALALVVIGVFLGTDLFSVKALLLVALGYLLVWLGAYLAHTFVSPEGVELYRAFREWNHIDREQTERFRQYRERTE